MKILVGVKRVVDHTAKIRVKTDGSGIDTSELKMSINPFDAVALEEAVRLFEAGLAEEVIAITIGPSSSREVLRHALAQGAHRAFHILTEPELSPLNIARVLKKIVEQEQAWIVMLGKQAIDADNQQVGQMLAGLLQWSQATCASQIQVQKNHWQIKRDIDSGSEVINIKLPAVITTELRLNQPRDLNVMNILKAKQKTITTIELKELKINLSNTLKIIGFVSAPERKAGMLVPDVSTLINKLRHEAKVI